MVQRENVDAQDLVYDAMEAWGTPDGPEKLKRALLADPEHPDALGMAAGIAETAEEARSLLSRALASAEERLGPNFEKKYRGGFWLAHETRPYMRTLALIAQLEEALGRRKESIAILEKMIKLNPNDNQGIRFELIGKLLAERMLVKCRKLFELYPDESAAWFPWGQVLYHFTMKDRTTATRLLKKARRQNPYVEHYLSGAEPIPDELPDFYSPGEETEAILVANDLLEAWSRRQHALLWLAAQLSGQPDLVRHVARMIDGR